MEVVKTESLQAFADRIKSAERRRLWRSVAEDGKDVLEQVLSPAQWVVRDKGELVWPGDLGDAPEDPFWMTKK
jgi:hypothetical protein